jgi:hypothetical protein
VLSIVIVGSGSVARALGTVVGIGLWVAVIVWFIRWRRTKNTGKLMASFEPNPSLRGAKPVPMAQRAHTRESGAASASTPEPLPPGDWTAPS